MDVKSIRTGASEVANYFFENKKGHLDSDLLHISVNEIRHNLKENSKAFSEGAKVFLEGLLCTNTFLTINNLHQDSMDGISFDDIKALEKLENAEVESFFASEVYPLVGSKGYGINTRENIHTFSVVTINNERKILYVARGDKGNGSTGIYINNISDAGIEYVGLEHKPINNSDFFGIDVILDNNELKITISNGADSINIRKVDNNTYQFNIGGPGKTKTYTIILYNQEVDKEKEEYKGYLNKHFIHVSQINRNNLDIGGRLILLSYNNNGEPNRVSLPFSFEEVTINSLEIESFDFENIVKAHLSYPNDDAFQSASTDQLVYYSLLSECESKSSVATTNGVYVFGQKLEKQYIFFINKNGEISLVNKGIGFGDIIGEENGRIVGAAKRQDSLYLLVEARERKKSITHRRYYILKLNENDIMSKEPWKVKPIKLLLPNFPVSAELRDISIDNRVVYILSDDQPRVALGGYEHMVHELSANNSKLILGE